MNLQLFVPVAQKTRDTRDSLIAMMEHHAAFTRSVKNVFHHDYVDQLRREGVASDPGSARDLQRYVARSAILTVQVMEVKDVAVQFAPYVKVTSGAGIKNATPSAPITASQQGIAILLPVL